MRTEQKDLIYIPKFINESGLNELVQDIHAQHEDGWEGDAQSFSSVSRAMKCTDFPYLIAIGNSDTIFAFTSKSDRDCVISDYLSALDVW